jgi:SulP family sulfate permease
MPSRIAPFADDSKKYSKGFLKADLIAGLTVAVFAVPQAMAYAMLAGVAPVYGLYAAVVMSIIAALWGSSPYLNTGPTNSAALLTSAALLPFVAEGDHMRHVVTLCFLVGIIRLVMGLARMGSLLDFVPESAFLGFTVGAGLLIAMGQFHHLLGVTPPESSWFPARMIETFGKAGELHPLAPVTALGVLAVMLLFSDRYKRFPVALVAIGVSAAGAWLLGQHHPLFVVRDIAPIPTGLPPISVPSFDPVMLGALLPAAAAIAAVGLIEASSISQALALRHGQRLDVNQEFIGQGLSHIVGSFVSAIPGSGSFSRSILIEAAGGVTRFANVLFGLATMVALLTVPRLLEWIPVAALSGLLIYIGIKLVDLRRIRRVFATSNADATMMIITFLVTVFYRVEFGIFAGILGSALVHLHRSRELKLVEYVPVSDGRIAELPYGQDVQHGAGTIVALGVSGDLFYGVSSELRNQLNDVIDHQQPTHLILRMRRTHSIDYSCWSVLFDMAERMHREGRKLYLCGVRSDFQPIIKQAGMEEVLPHLRIFPATDSPFQAFDACISSILASTTLSDPRSLSWCMRSPGSADLPSKG